MADDEKIGKGPRVVVHVSPEMQFMLTQLAARMLLTKKQLHTDIWEAGIRSLLGVDPKEVEGARLVSLPRMPVDRPDAKRLAQMMIEG